MNFLPFISYLVTKDKYYHKPTYDSLQQTLTQLKELCEKHLVTSLAMPKIGCGLDKLEWSTVKSMIKNTFLSFNIKITVYSLDDPDNSKTIWLKMNC